MSQPEIDYLGEGRSDEVVARRLIEAAAAVPGVSYQRPRSGTGKQNLDSRLVGLNAGARYGNPVLVLRDLDTDAPCAPTLVAQLLPDRHERLLLRVCVRTAEAWFMADAEAYARFCGIPARHIPSMPETLVDPKGVILGWANSKRTSALGTHVKEGRRRGVPNWRILGEWHAEFAEGLWSPVRAADSGRAPSLTKALTRLKSLVKLSRAED